MKKLIIWVGILFALTCAQNTFSQRIGDLNGIYYQAVAIDENGKEIVGMDVEGKPLYEKAIGVRFTVTKGLDGAVQWQETHTTNTDKYGLFTLVIGKGTPTGSAAYTKMLDIPWIDADQWLKVEIASKNDGNYKMVSNQQFMSVPYSFYTDDIADDAITSPKILDSAIVNRDVKTAAINSRTLLDETILAEDINTGAVTSSELLDETILAEDIDTSAVTSSELLDETILAEDIDTSAVTSSELLDGTILNEDIANGTIDLTAKVTGILPVANGGTGANTLPANGLLVGSGTSGVQSLGQAANGQIPIGVTGGAPVLGNITAGTGIIVTNTPGGIQIASGVQGINSSLAGNVNIGNPGGCPGGMRNLAAGLTWTSPSISGVAVIPGNIVVGSLNYDLQGCMMTTYVRGNNIIQVSIYNGTGQDACFPAGLELRVLVVQ